MELIKCHLILQEFPTELWFIINVGDLWQGIGLSGWDGHEVVCDAETDSNDSRTRLRVKPLRNNVSGFLELLEEGRRDSQEINTGKSFDLASLVCK